MFVESGVKHLQPIAQKTYSCAFCAATFFKIMTWFPKYYKFIFFFFLPSSTVLNAWVMVLMVWRSVYSCYYLNLWTISSNNFFITAVFYAYHKSICTSLRFNRLYISWKCKTLLKSKKTPCYFIAIFYFNVQFQSSQYFYAKVVTFIYFLDNKIVFEQI